MSSLENSSKQQTKKEISFSKAETLAETAIQNIPMFAHYRILAELGRGGMGIVYKALDTRLQRHVALKVVMGKNESNEILRLQKEATALAQLEHPNIVKILEAGSLPQPYFSMEYIAGESLLSWVHNKKPTPSRILKIFIKLASALHHAHKKGFLHRDIKPSNIIIDHQDEPKILDFGLAKSLESAKEKRHTLSKTGDILGTPSYMPPEQAEGVELDTRSDIYSLGATLYEVLTGKPPFDGDNYLSILMKIANEEILPLRKICPEISPYLEAICLKCLEKKAENRYADARLLAKDLQNFLAHRPISARRYTFAYTLIKFFQHKKMVCIASSVIVFLCFLLYKTWDARIKESQYIQKKAKSEIKNIQMILKENENAKKIESIIQLQKKSFDKNLEKQQNNTAIEYAEQIRKSYDQLIEIYKKNPEKKSTACFAIGYLYHFSFSKLALSEQKKFECYEIALGFYHSAIEADSKNWQAYLNRGKLYLYEKACLELSIQDFNYIISKIPNADLMECYLNRGTAYLKLANTIKSTTPQSHETTINYQNAIDDFTKVIQNEGSRLPIAYTRRANAYYELQNSKAAWDDLNIALKERPNCQETNYHLAVALLLSKKTQEAISCFEKAASLKDEGYFIRIKTILCALYYERKEYKKTISCSQEALDHVEGPNAVVFQKFIYEAQKALQKEIPPKSPK